MQARGSGQIRQCRGLWRTSQIECKIQILELRKSDCDSRHALMDLAPMVQHSLPTRVGTSSSRHHLAEFASDRSNETIGAALVCVHALANTHAKQHMPHTRTHNRHARWKMTNELSMLQRRAEDMMEQQLSRLSQRSKEVTTSLPCTARLASYSEFQAVCVSVYVHSLFVCVCMY